MIEVIINKVIVPLFTLFLVLVFFGAFKKAYPDDPVSRWVGSIFMAILLIGLMYLYSFTSVLLN